jgi:hypothetical protein
MELSMTQKKLTLNRETLLHLADDLNQGVQGGAPGSVQICPATPLCTTATISVHTKQVICVIQTFTCKCPVTSSIPTSIHSIPTSEPSSIVGG